MKSITKFIDMKLMIIVILLCCIGFIAVSSATKVYLYGNSREIKIQFISFFIGIVLMTIGIMIDYKYYGVFHWLIYALGLLSLLLVYVPGLGRELYEARSWIKLGSIYVQTSEMTKLAYILVLAKVLCYNKNGITTIRDLLIPAFMSIPYFFLIFKQPDLGTMLVFLFIFMGMVFVARIPFKMIVVFLLIFAILLPTAYSFLSPYQQRRIDSFISPDKADNHSKFQSEMSQIAIGSGRIHGEGIYSGQFSSNNFLPVQESDFIYSVWVEETGFWGGLALIVLYFLLCTRIIMIAFKSKDDYGSYICIGVLCMYAFQIFENLGMTMGMMPITGVPLPFVSYGGSSMVVNMIALSFVMNVNYRAYLKRVRED